MYREPYIESPEHPKKPRLHDRYIATILTTWANYGDGNPEPNGKYRRQFVYEWQEPRGLIPSRIHNPVVSIPEVSEMPLKMERNSSLKGWYQRRNKGQ
jgi:hypothetical protein